MITRRTFILSSAAILAGSMTGCDSDIYKNTSLTKKLYDKINSTQHTEMVDRVLFSEDGKKLVFIGPKYHYIFDAPESFKEFVNSPLGITKDIAVGWFKVNASDASITATIGLSTIVYDENSVKELAKVAGKWGLSPYGGGKTYYVGNFTLTGTRYSTKNFNMLTSANTTFIKWPFKITVSETMPTGEKNALMLLTPLTVTADGFIFLGDILLIALYIAAIPFAELIDKFNHSP